MAVVLFICTGNTCRSPMAECLFNHMAQGSGHSALSAGVYAAPGQPASAGARRAMQRRGLSLESHQSRPLTDAVLEQADLVAGMSRSHIAALRAQFPAAAVPLFAFDDPPISDPYGGDDSDYERAARDLERQLPALLNLLNSPKPD